MKQLPIVTALLLAFAAPTVSGDGRDDVRARLSGIQEVPVVSTVATGRFTAEISRDEQAIDWTLSYTALQGVVTQAHVHVAQKNVNGAIVLWLCGTTSNPGPAGTQVCTPGSGNFTGRATAADIVAPTPAPQQILAGELAEVIAAIRAGVAYANVHTNLSPGGEIRGQLDARGHGHDDDDD